MQYNYWQKHAQTPWVKRVVIQETGYLRSNLKQREAVLYYCCSPPVV